MTVTNQLDKAGKTVVAVIGTAAAVKYELPANTPVALPAFPRTP